MIDRSLSLAGPLLVSRNRFPAAVISGYARQFPEEVRAMFIDLFDESKDLVERIENFKAKAADIHPRAGGRSHFQDENVIITYLWLRYPEKYCIYKFNVVKNLSQRLEAGLAFKRGDYPNNIRNFMELYNEVTDELKKDSELKSLLANYLTDECYPDSNFRTAATDFGFYVSKTDEIVPPEPLINQDTSKNYWWLYTNPNVWSFSELQVNETKEFLLSTNAEDDNQTSSIFAEIKAGDSVIGYEGDSVKKIVTLGEIESIDNESLRFKKKEELLSPINLIELKDLPNLAKMEFFQNPHGTLFKLTEEEYNTVLQLIREGNPLEPGRAHEPYSKEDFLNEVYLNESRYDSLRSVLENKKNIILQGPPGVGKTFAAKRLAYSMMGQKDDSRIEFIQFHQNYSYEDFMMGYRPEGSGFELKYGIFYRFCEKAANNPDKDYFFIIDEINRGNMSKIFGELLMLIERDYRGTKATLAYNNMPFSVPENLYIIGMMNTADRSLALIDYALRRRFSFIEMNPAFDTKGFQDYQSRLNSETLDNLILRVKDLNKAIEEDQSLGRGFRIGHSYFCEQDICTDDWLRSVVEFDILPMLNEYWFDDPNKLMQWENALKGVLQ